MYSNQGQFIVSERRTTSLYPKEGTMSLYSKKGWSSYASSLSLSKTLFPDVGVTSYNKELAQQVPHRLWYLGTVQHSAREGHLDVQGWEENNETSHELLLVSRVSLFQEPCEGKAPQESFHYRKDSSKKSVEKVYIITHIARWISCRV